MKGLRFSAWSFAISCALAFNLMAFFYADFEAMTSGGFASSAAISIMRTLVLLMVAYVSFTKGVRNSTVFGALVASALVYLLIRILDAELGLAVFRMLGYASIGVVGALGLVYMGNVISTIFQPHEAHVCVTAGFALAAVLMLLALGQSLVPMSIVRSVSLVAFLVMSSVLFFRGRRADLRVSGEAARQALGGVRGIVSLPLTAGVGPIATYSASVLLMFGFGLFETHIAMSAQGGGVVGVGSVFVALLLSVAMLLVVLVDDGLAGKNRFFLVVCSITLAAVVGMALLPGFEGHFFTALSAAILVLQVPIFMFLYDMSSEGVPPAFLFAFTQVLVGLAHVMGRLASYAVSTVVGFENVTVVHIAAVVLAIITLVVVVGLVFLVRSIDKGSVRLSADAGLTEAEPQRSPRDVRLQELRDQFGLSERELSIVALYTQGRSVPFISTELNLARSTVKTHIGNVYSKMGIHTKQELLDAMDGVSL